jgi:hypothetical protein
MVHPRGVFQHEIFPGIIEQSIYNCAGRHLACAWIVKDCIDPSLDHAAERALERWCPEGHAGECPSASPSTKLVVDARRSLAFSVETETPQPVSQIPARSIHLESSA